MGAGRQLARTVIGLLAGAALFAATPAFSAATNYTVGPVTDISASCSSQNAEIEQAVDQKAGYVYEAFMGCRGIAFDRSTNGGATFETPISVPGSIGSDLNTSESALPRPPHGTVVPAVLVVPRSHSYADRPAS